MDKKSNDSEVLIKSMAKLLENIEIDEIDTQKSIDNIKNIAKKLEKDKIEYKNNND